MKNTILLLIGFLFAVQSYAADFGLGLTVATNTRDLLIPIKVSDDLRVEPLIGMYSSSGEKDSNGDNVSKKKDVLGVGVYVTDSKSSSTRMYYGGRFTQDNYSETSNYTRKGQYLAAVLGFEYLFASNFSLGGEAFYSMDSDKYDFENKEDYTLKSTYTGSQVIIRYYFD